MLTPYRNDRRRSRFNYTSHRSFLAAGHGYVKVLAEIRSAYHKDDTFWIGHLKLAICEKFEVRRSARRSLDESGASPRITVTLTVRRYCWTERVYERQHSNWTTGSTISQILCDTRVLPLNNCSTARNFYVARYWETCRIVFTMSVPSQLSFRNTQEKRNVSETRERKFEAFHVQLQPKSSTNHFQIRNFLHTTQSETHFGHFNVIPCNFIRNLSISLIPREL